MTVIVGTEQLTAVGRDLIAASEFQLKRNILAAIRHEAKAAIPDIQDSARSTLPSSGGFAEEVATQAYAVRTSLSGSVASVKLVGKGMGELRDINDGNMRHPVFGNREVWKRQNLPKGFFSDPIVKRAPEIREAIHGALELVAAELAAKARVGA